MSKEDMALNLETTNIYIYIQKTLGDNKTIIIFKKTLRIITNMAFNLKINNIFYLYLKALGDNKRLVIFLYALSAKLKVCLVQMKQKFFKINSFHPKKMQF